MLADVLMVWPPRENMRSVRTRLQSLVHPVKAGDHSGHNRPSVQKLISVRGRLDSQALAPGPLLLNTTARNTSRLEGVESKRHYPRCYKAGAGGRKPGPWELVLLIV